MIEIATDFPYLGSRDYIHGTSLLSGFIEALERRGVGDIKVKRLKFQHQAHTNGRLVVSTGALPEAECQAANCVFAATGGSALWRGLYAENGTAVARRVAVAYPIAELAARGFGGSCRIAARDRDDLIRTLVEANKRFHEAAVETSSAVRFGYIEDWAVPAAKTGAAGTLEARNLIARRTEDGYMTINRLTYVDTAGASATLTLCFNVSAKAP